MDWKVLGKRHDRVMGEDWEMGEWEAKGESIYSSSTTLSIKELVESSPRYYQPFYSTIVYFIKGKHPRVYVLNCWQIFQRTTTNDFDGIIYERKS